MCTTEFIGEEGGAYSGRDRYRQVVSKKGKTALLDGFLAPTGYPRKYAVALLNEQKDDFFAKNEKGKKKRKMRAHGYDKPLQEALTQLW